MRLQVDIPDNINKKLKYYKLDEEKNNLAECVVDILTKFFEKKNE